MQFIFRNKANVYLIIIVAIILSSCSPSIRNYPNKPFVYNNKINIQSKINEKEKKRLTEELNNYWDDSLQIRKQSKLGFFYTKIIENPAVYDTLYSLRTIKFMENYLKTQGYYYSTSTFDTTNSVVNNLHRVTTTININLGNNISIDSVAFDLVDSNLQKLVKENEINTLLKQGQPYTKQTISNELDRITALFNRNGYYNFKRDDIYALVDTTDSKFLNLTTDPFELVRLLEEYNKSKMQNPKWDITIKQRKDTTGKSSRKFYIGRVYYYPEARSFDLIDTNINRNWRYTNTYINSTLKFDNEIIKIAPLRKHTYLHRGEVYNNINLYNTLNALSKLGTWKQIDARFIERDNDTLDVYIALVPDKKYGIENTAEVSKNTGDLTAGNLIGLSANITFRDRNVAKQAIQSFTSLRAGIELSPNESNNTLQTFFITAGQTYSFPKMSGEKLFKSCCDFFRSIFISKTNDSIRKNTTIRSLTDKRTLLSLNASYNDRLDLFRLRSLTGNYGWEFKKDNRVWQYSPINIELYSLDKLAGLDSLIKQNPFLQLSFNTGNVIGQTFNYVTTYPNKTFKNRLHYLRVGFEESGLITGLSSSLNDKVYRYVKLEAEYKEKRTFANYEIAGRIFGGIGYNYSSSSELGQTLPFFKQFFVGGPNSMRAWGLRQLGLGSSLLSDTSSSSFKDRFGDIKLEANIELRFNLLKTSFVKVGSVLFADIGNIWNLKKSNENPNSEFNLSRLGKDIAIGVGTGLRFDFTIFLIRIDAAYKVKDPAREYNNGWINLKNASLSEYTSNGVFKRNLAVQLGIGLPF